MDAGHGVEQGERDGSIGGCGVIARHPAHGSRDSGHHLLVGRGRRDDVLFQQLLQEGRTLSGAGDPDRIGKPGVPRVSRYAQRLGDGR